MEIVRIIVCTSRVVNTYHFVKSSAYLVLKIELLLTKLSNFERKAGLKDLAF